MDHRDLEGRVAVLERESVIAKSAARAARAVVVAMGVGYIWFLSQQYEEWKKVRENTSQIVTDLILVKEEQKRFSRESDRAWRLLNAIIKKGSSDVSSSLERE